MKTRSLIFLSLLFLFLGPLLLGQSVAQAQFATGPIASAVGGAGRASLDPSEAGLLNPAAVAHLQRYYFSGNYGISNHEREGDLKQYGLLLADGTEGNSFPGSLSYTRRNLDSKGGGTETQSDIQLSLAEFFSERIALGFTVHRQSNERSQSIAGGGEYTQYNGHIGLMLTPWDFVGLGLVAYDILPPREGVPSGIRTVPTFALGTNLIIQKILHVRLDLVRPDLDNPNRRTNVMAGFDTYFREDFAARVGVMAKETADQTYFTAGLGYKGPKLSIDYTYQKDTRVADSGRHLFDLWLPF
jgi:hypothetical protein